MQKGWEYNTRPEKKDVENEIKCALTSFQEEARSEITVRLLTGDCNHPHSTAIKLKNKAANEGTFHSCVPFTVTKLNLQTKFDPGNNSGNAKTCVVSRYVTNLGDKGFFWRVGRKALF